MFAGPIGLVNLLGILALDPLLMMTDTGLAKISGLFSIFLHIAVSQFVTDPTYTGGHVVGLYKKAYHII